MDDLKDIDEAILALQRLNLTVKKTAEGALRAGRADKYADLGEYNRVVLTALNELGVIWTCLPTLSGENFVLAYSLKHVPSGTEKVGEFPLPKSEPQKMGSAITYGRRYALGAVTGVTAEGEDDDGNVASGRQQAQRAAQQGRARQQPAPEGRQARRAQLPPGGRPPLPGENADPAGPVGADQHRHMRALWSDLNVGGDEHRDFRLRKTAEWLGLESLDSSANLTREQADRVIVQLRATKDQRQQSAPAEGGAE
jgi:hypothetical protein